MKYYLLFIFILLITQTHCLSQHSFEFFLSTPEDDVLIESVVDNQGNVILVGRIGNVTEEKYDAYIVKVLPDGSYQEKHFEKQDTIGFFSGINILDNGNYFVTGRYSVNGSIDTCDHFWVVIMDANLEVVSEKYYLAPEGYLGFWSNRNAIIDEDGFIALVTEVGRQYTHYEVADFIMYKFNQEGDTLLSKLYPSWNSSSVYSLCPIPESDSIMMLGRGSLSNGSESMDFMDKDMNISRSVNLETVHAGKRYSNNIWVNGNEFLMASNRIVDVDKKREYFFSIFRMNTSGEYLQELLLDRPDTLEYRAVRQAMVQANDSTIYVSGYQSHNIGWTTLPSTSIIYLIDTNMNLVGRVSLGGDANYVLWGITTTPDNGVLAYGTRYKNEGSFARDIHVRKFLREDFEIITQLTDQPAAALNSRVWPNPANDVLHISLEGLQTGSDFRLRIYNIAGQKYFDKAFKVTAEAVQCHIEVLPAGTYVYELQTAAGQASTGKFIKQ
ncbi:MAG: T9SS type A sorting domain-containing protein [Bacteroidales bacterium]|nr:T9SS type A sorting domain-containing protein [Bacteroidales bacterium]